MEVIVTREQLVYMKNMVKSFGQVRALQGASIEIRPGITTAIVGDNGSGKSTLVKILSGNLKPDSGTISIGGQSHASLTIPQSLALGIRTVYQDLSLDNQKNSAENIFLGAELMRGPFLRKKAMLAQTRALLAAIQVRIDDLALPAGRLSGGQRQGLAIARALRAPGRLLVLDEPMSAMGIQESHRTARILKGLKEQGLTQLIVSHNLFQVFDLADRIFVMRAGACIADVQTAQTTPEEIQALILRRETETAAS